MVSGGTILDPTDLRVAGAVSGVEVSILKVCALPDYIQHPTINADLVGRSA